jgi:hypothetical protein
MNVSDILTLVLGGGLVATIAAIFKGIQALREGARAKERDLVGDLEDWRAKANRARELAEAQRDYWREKAADYRFILRDMYGHQLPPERPPTAIQQEQQEEIQS